MFSLQFLFLVFPAITNIIPHGLRTAVLTSKRAKPSIDSHKTEGEFSFSDVRSTVRSVRSTILLQQIARVRMIAYTGRAGASDLPRDGSKFNGAKRDEPPGSN